MNEFEKIRDLNVDICCGLAWGDEAKGKIVSHLAASGKYDFVCRWAGGHNAGHTIYKNKIKYKTHLIPSGVFYGVLSIIGPDCVVEKSAFLAELDYLKQNGFDTNLIKISPKCHVVQKDHLIEDKNKYVKSQGSTAKGIAPCYRDKYARLGSRVEDPENIDFFKKHLWDEKLYGNVLCEGAQGFWLDINYGNYPYVTSSNTLPYGACSLGFPLQSISNIYGAAKIYDTRSGIDPDFPESLLDDNELSIVCNLGKEFGVTTGRRRKVNWLNLDKLSKALLTTGTTSCIISKTDILQDAQLFKLFDNNKLHAFNNLDDMKEYIDSILLSKCPHLKNIIYSDDVEKVDGL
tara:strand:+ start:283 stop:1323 length:1041 start_codon:yes stop_codon:yes gene_type:complete